MSYKYEDFLHDYDEEEDYLGREDELSFVYSLDRAYAGDAEYMRVLGDVYSISGHGVKVDYKKAAFWFERAAELGDSYSAASLADLYFDYDGEGIPHDYEKAFCLYERAAECGNVKATSRLGIMCLYGLGCEKDFVRARKLLERATQTGDGPACYEFAHILKDEGAENWREYLEKAATCGSGNANWEIIQNFADGLTDKQFKIYLIYAANYCEFNYSPTRAQLMLADCFMHGKRMEQSADNAKSYYLAAAEAGSSEAKEALEKFFGN